MHQFRVSKISDSIGIPKMMCSLRIGPTDISAIFSHHVKKLFQNNLTF